MQRNELYQILKKLSQGYIEKKIKEEFYAQLLESLIVFNLDIIPELEELSDFLAQYKHNPDMPELYDDKELTKKIKKIFKLK